jgi:hypothetical protein
LNLQYALNRSGIVIVFILWDLGAALCYLAVTYPIITSKL